MELDIAREGSFWIGGLLEGMFFERGLLGKGAF